MTNHNSDSERSKSLTIAHRVKSDRWFDHPSSDDFWQGFREVRRLRRYADGSTEHDARSKAQRVWHALDDEEE